MKWPADTRAFAFDEKGRLRKCFRVRAPSHIRRTHIRLRTVDGQQRGANVIIDHPIAAEGLSWCFGWTGPAVEALKVSAALV